MNILNEIKRSVIARLIILAIVAIALLPSASFAVVNQYGSYVGYLGWTGPLAGLPGNYINDQSSAHMAAGNLFQIIYAGSDGTINLPDVNGNPSGDDRLVSQNYVGRDYEGGGFSNEPGMFFVYSGAFTAESTAGTPKLYVRAWNATTISSATYYGNSGLITAYDTAGYIDPSAAGNFQSTFSTLTSYTPPANTPAITFVNPPAGTTGTSPVIITGSNFGTSGTVNFKLITGTTKYPATVNGAWSSSSLSIVVPAAAGPGTYEISITNNSAQTGTWTTFYHSVPFITGETPASGPTGTSVTLIGYNFGTSGTLYFDNNSGSPLTPSASFNNSTVTFTVPGGASNGAYDVYVQTASGTSNRYTFNVGGIPVIAFTSITPSTGSQGQTLTGVAIVGSNTHFDGTTTVDLGSNITVSGISVSNSTNLTCNITIGASATIGARNVVVTTGSETVTGASAFTVTSVTPAFSSITPASGAQGATLTGVAIVGSNTHFGGTTTVALGANITVNNIVATDSEHLTCDIVIDASAATGARNVVVTTGGETVTGTGAFTVNTPDDDRFFYEKTGGIMMAYPNPFNPNDKANPLTMLFSAATGEAVDIYIFDTNARIIYQSRDHQLLADRKAYWDGETSYGEVVDNGLYLIRIVKDGRLVAKGKILVIKK